jgi:ketosteroid isomerase-like protein
MKSALVALLLVAVTPSFAAADLAPREVVQLMFAAFNRHDAIAMAALYASNARLNSSDFCVPRGKGDVERTYAALFAAFPDIEDNVDSMVASGDRVAVRFTARSRLGSPALDLRIMTFITVRTGRIVEDDSIFDTKGGPCRP